MIQRRIAFSWRGSRERLRPDIPIIEVDANMEDPAFARVVAEQALEMFG